MKRRSLLFGVAAALPAWHARPVHAQRLRRVAYLGIRSGPNEFEQSFARGLAELGYTVGRNLIVDYRWADNDLERHRALAAELLALNPDVFVISDGAASSVSRVNTVIPIVVPMLGDPIRSGLTQSLARPDGQVTGLSALAAELSAKRLELLKDTVPGLKRAGALYNARRQQPPLGVKATRDAGSGLGIEVIDLPAQLPDGADAAIAAAARQGVQAVALISDTATISHRGPICEALQKHRMPVIFANHTYLRAGGLMSYGPDLEAAFHRSAALVDRLLKGARVADLPIEQPTTVRLVINRRVARAIGLSLPAALLQRADEVID